MLPTQKSKSEMFSHGSSHDKCSLIESTKPKRVTLLGSAISAFEDKIQRNKKKGMSNIPQKVREYVADENARSFQIPVKNVQRQSPVRRNVKRINSSMLVAGKITLNTKEKAPTPTNRTQLERNRSRRLQRRRSSKLDGLRDWFASNERFQDQNSVEDKLSRSQDSTGFNFKVCDGPLSQGNNALDDEVKIRRGSSKTLSTCEDLSENSLTSDDNIEQRDNPVESTILKDERVRAYLIKYGRKLSAKSLPSDDNIEQTEDPIESTILKDESIRAYLIKYGRKLSKKNVTKGDNIKQTECPIESTLLPDERIRSYLIKYGRKLSKKNLTNGNKIQQTGGPIQSSMSKDERIRAYLIKYGKKLSQTRLNTVDNIKQTRGSKEGPIQPDLENEEEQIKTVFLKGDQIESGLVEEDRIKTDLTKEDPIEPYLEKEEDRIEAEAVKKPKKKKKKGGKTKRSKAQEKQSRKERKKNQVKKEGRRVKQKKGKELSKCKGKDSSKTRNSN